MEKKRGRPVGATSPEVTLRKKVREMNRQLAERLNESHMASKILENAEAGDPACLNYLNQFTRKERENKS